MEIKNKIFEGDVLDWLPKFPNNSVDVIITSPPYYQLRDYGIENQIGLEDTYQDYIKNLLKVFNEAYRILKSEGSMWVVLGDTYSGIKKGNDDALRSKKMVNATKRLNKRITDIKPKSLTLIPHRLVIEMLNNGWILRNRIIWHKNNPIPRAVKDRFTRSYEEIFFFVKKPKGYYFNQMLEDGVKGKRNMRDVWNFSTKGYKGLHFATYPPKLVKRILEASCPPNGIVFDPFAGSGTTLVVAKKMGFNYSGIELNPEYVEIINKRLEEIDETLQF